MPSPPRMSWGFCLSNASGAQGGVPWRGVARPPAKTFFKFSFDTHFRFGIVIELQVSTT